VEAEVAEEASSCPPDFFFLLDLDSVLPEDLRERSEERELYLDYMVLKFECTF